MRVRLDSGQKITVSPKAYDSFQLGYASTIHKAQGATVERSYVLLGETMQDKNLSYVQLSRHREKAELFVDMETAGRGYGDVITRMKRDREPMLAHDIHEYQEQDLWQHEEQRREEYERLVYQPTR